MKLEKEIVTIYLGSKTWIDWDLCSSAVVFSPGGENSADIIRSNVIFGAE